MESKSISFSTAEPNILICKVQGVIGKENHQDLFDIVKSGYFSLRPTDVIFDLGDVAHLSATGITLFEQTLRIFKPRQGSVILANLSEQVSQSLKMYGLINSFEVSNSTPQAIALIKDKASIDSFYIRCPNCNENIKINYSGKYTCEKCDSVMDIAEDRSITVPAILKQAKKDNAENTFPIHIYGEDELVLALQNNTEQFKYCISIGNPGQIIPNEIKDSFEKILRLEFYDVDDVSSLNETQIKRIPEIQDAQQAIDFVDQTRKIADGYVIHCWQGISRSTAIGLAVLKILYPEEKDLEKAILQIRPEASPHKKLISYFDSIMNTDLASIAERIQMRKIERIKEELRLINET